MHPALWRVAHEGRRLCAALLVIVALAACGIAPARAPELAVRELWDEYLSSKADRYAASAATPTTLWSAAEQERWPLYDLVTSYVPDHAVPEVLRVAPDSFATDGVYSIVTRFWPAGVTPGDSTATPLLTTTVYARREGRRWVLANPLPYRTSQWTRETRGRIAYFVAPGLRFDATRAERAAAFVDSLATALEVQAPERIDYYVTESVDQALEILGVDHPDQFGAAGGFAKPINAQVFSGIPTLGEDYRHELAHVLLLPIIRDGTTTLLASEGVPTWVGGTAGRDYAGSVQYLAEVVKAQPRLDLHRILWDTSIPSTLRNAAGAVLAEMVHEAGGVDALRSYLRSSEAAIPDTLERLLGQPWDDLADEWLRRVERGAGSGSQNDDGLTTPGEA